MTVVSDAFLATITIPYDVLSKDRLLFLICGLAPELQLTVHVVPTSSSGVSALELKLFNGTVVTQRNAILRTMCSLFVQLDFIPYMLLAGASSYGNSSSTPTHRANMSGISSWMSTTINNDLDDTFVSQLNDHLATQSYLVQSCSPTLADLDLYFCLVDSFHRFKDKLPSHVARWFQTVQYTASIFVQEIKSKQNHLPWIQQHINLLDWRNEEHDLPHRSAMIQEIEIFVKEQDEMVVKQLETSLYKSAPSLEAYKDETTLKSRLESLIQPMPVFFYGQDPNDDSCSSPMGIVPMEVSDPATTSNDAAPTMTDEQKKAAADKRAKKAAEKAAKKVEATSTTNSSSTDTYDISSLDIRVGHILRAWNHDSADKLYCEEIDLGTEVRQIASGLRPYYTLDEMQHRSVLVLCNLKARNLVGFASHGMVLCATSGDTVEFVCAPEGAILGERVVFEGYDGKEPEVDSKVAKKKIFEKVAPDLGTDEMGKVVWKGAKAMTSAGECFAVSLLPNAHVS